ncbi:MAG: aminotransferase class IV [Gemmatimonadales bacterium]|nr:aminotransferase class IV [Gemmatimonadales bacterium]
MMRVGPGLGLIETMRSRAGYVPLLERHLRRLHASVAALHLDAAPADLDARARAAVGSEDQVVRVDVRRGRAEFSTRAIAGGPFPAIMVSSEPHEPYYHKTTAREAFGRAFAGARRAGADDAVLVTRRGHVAEGTAWSLFWWDRTGDCLCTPAADLGILPGIGRARVIELAEVQEVRLPVSALARRSLFLVNAVRGVVEIGTLEGKPVPRDPRTVELSRRFWPD